MKGVAIGSLPDHHGGVALKQAVHHRLVIG